MSHTRSPTRGQPPLAICRTCAAFIFRGSDQRQRQSTSKDIKSYQLPHDYKLPMLLKRTARSGESKSFVWAQLNECAVVGDRVPGTHSTPLPLICGTVWRTACADAAYRASTFWFRREADRHDNHHLRTHSHSARRQSHAAKQTDWLSTPTHTESATQPAEWGTTAMIIRALTETQGARLSLGFLTLIKRVPLQYAKHFSLAYARSKLHTPRRTVTNSKPLFFL